MFLFTSVLVLVAFGSMSVFTLVVDKGWLDESITTQINFIPMVSVIVAYVGYGLGYGVIPSLIAAETMPVDVRSTAVGLFMTVEMLSTFLLSKLKPILMESLQIHGLFAMFSCKKNNPISSPTDCSCFRHSSGRDNVDVGIQTNKQ